MSRAFQEFGSRIRHELIRAALRSKCARKNGSWLALDIGCGWGELGKSMELELGYEVVYLDIVPNVLKGFARYRVCGDARNLPFRDMAFDEVVSSDVLEHIRPRDKQRFLREMARVARYGVALTFSTFCSFSYVARFFKIWFSIFRSSYPGWFVDHDASEPPSVGEVVGILNSSKMKISSRKPYFGILTATFIGFLWAFKFRPSRLGKVLRLLVNNVGFILCKIVDLPPYVGWLVVAERRSTSDAPVGSSVPRPIEPMLDHV